MPYVGMIEKSSLNEGRDWEPSLWPGGGYGWLDDPRDATHPVQFTRTVSIRAQRCQRQGENSGLGPDRGGGVGGGGGGGGGVEGWGWGVGGLGVGGLLVYDRCSIIHCPMSRYNVCQTLRPLKDSMLLRFHA